jgi:hypothetical protein
VLRLAADGADRLKCWYLVYQEYVAMGYAPRKELEYRYSVHDALPEAATFIVEYQGEPVGTVSVFPDSPLGLPADEIYRDELNAMRAAGRRLVEVGRLTIRGEHKHEREILVNLFDALSIYGRRVCWATDLVITVNPSHAKFYERMILFERAGGEKSLGSVCGAAAVLLRLRQMEVEVPARRHAHDEGPKPAEWLGHRTFYPYLSGRREEDRRVDRMREVRRPPAEEFLKRYFVRLRPLIMNLPPALRGFMHACYPEYSLPAGGPEDFR